MTEEKMFQAEGTAGAKVLRWGVCLLCWGEGKEASVTGVDE